jgi:hypothetical protein
MLTDKFHDGRWGARRIPKSDCFLK